MEEYNDLCERAQNIIINRGYQLVIENINGTYNFNIYNNGTIISNLQMIITTGNILIGKTRGRYQNYLEEQPQEHFKILWIHTSESFRGQKLALLLMIYSICYIKLYNPMITFVTLDDDSNQSIYIQNIYNLLRFEFREPIQIDMSNSKKLKISGPEKQLFLDTNFIIQSNKILDSISNNLTKNTKKNRRKNKRKNTKKNRRKMNKRK